MREADTPEFVKLLNLCYSTVLRPLPTFESIDLWVTLLEPYSIDQVRIALSQHMRESKFPPVPADVLQRLPKESDGRPEADEAWAIALRARDERDTVVWTSEIAEAWNAALPVLDGDEIGARMAFKAAYARITERNRSTGVAARWTVSLGFDTARREEVVTHAVREGRLQLSAAVAAVPLLAGPSDDHACIDVAANLARLRSMVAGIPSARDRAAAAAVRRAREDAAQLELAKIDTARRVAEYERSHA